MTAPDKTHTYNGWTNRETWCVQLWLSNDEPSYHHWTAQAEETYHDTPGDLTHEERIDEAAPELARRLEDHHDEAQAQTYTGVFSDLLTSSLAAVDWDEIARAWLEPIEPDEENPGDDDDDQADEAQP